MVLEILVATGLALASADPQLAVPAPPTPVAPAAPATTATATTTTTPKRLEASRASTPQKTVKRVTPSAAESCASPTTDADALIAELRRASTERASGCKEDAAALMFRIGELERLLDAAQAENEQLRAVQPEPPKPPPPTTPDDVAALAKTVQHMKPPRAAAIVERLDDQTAVALLKKLKPELSAGILEQLKPERAATLAIGLVGRKS